MFFYLRESFAGMWGRFSKRVLTKKSPFSKKLQKNEKIKKKGIAKRKVLV